MVGEDTDVGVQPRVVAIGGSAGSLDALERFFRAMPAASGLSFIVVTHLAADHHDRLPELIGRATAMPVTTVTDRGELLADHVLVAPAGHDVTLERRAVRLHRRTGRAASRSTIDRFLRSVAADLGEGALGIVLSGMGSDGTRGLDAIRRAGGAVFAQEPDTATYDAMPRSAARLGSDVVTGAPEALAARVLERVRPLTADFALGRVFAILREKTGHDFSLYKRSTILSRLDRRLHACQVGLEEYPARLDADADEPDRLFKELLIGVTSFFREPEAFAVVDGEVLPALLARQGGPRTIRVWVAGCSTGEEAYSIAMLIREHLARAPAREHVKVQIFATDLDADAIAHARKGWYPAAIAADVSPDRLARWFVADEAGYRIRAEIRDTVVFAEHDLLIDPPFIRLDILMCRNVLIYLSAALQRRLLPMFHDSLDVGGVLVLGGSETVLAHRELFAPQSRTAKVFRRCTAPGRSLERRTATSGATRPGELTDATAQPARASSLNAAIDRFLLATITPPAVVITEQGEVVYSSRRTGRYLEPAPGAPSASLFAMARPGLAAPLRIAVREAVAKRRRVRREGIHLRGEARGRAVDLTVLPLDAVAGLRGLWLVVFEDAPRAKARRGAAERQLHSLLADLELSQEELGAANVRLQAANEDLQSTIEELTTSKEEQQSLNEELLSLNDQLQVTNDGLTQSNDDVRNLLDSTVIPTLFLDGELRIKRFTSHVRRIGNLLPGDVGRPVRDIALEVDVPGLVDDATEVMATLVPSQKDVQGRDGTIFAVRTHPYRTTDNAIDGVVITFVDVTAERRAEAVLRGTRERAS